MAFHQPVQTRSQRQRRTASPDGRVEPQISLPIRQSDDFREWILFTHTRSLTDTHTPTTVQHSPRQTDLSDQSPLSIPGASHRTIATSTNDGHEHGEEELDSLDDDLNAFHPILQAQDTDEEVHYVNQNDTIFPRHDGFGIFPASSPNLQGQIWRFEQLNSRKRSLSSQPRRRSSLYRRLEAIEDFDIAQAEDAKRARIEEWRIEHSRVLLDDEKHELQQPSSAGRRTQSTETEAVHVFSIDDSILGTDSHVHNRIKHGCDESLPEVCETFSERVLRYFAKDILGIDEDLLPVLFGEALPQEAFLDTRLELAVSLREEVTSILTEESKFLIRLASKLGFLLRQVSNYPGVFRTMPFMDPTTTIYGGMPVIQPISLKKQGRRRANLASRVSNIQEEADSIKSQDAIPQTTESRFTSTKDYLEEDPDSVKQEYWEQPADLRAIFRFIQSRFSSAISDTRYQGSSTRTIATVSTAESLRRTAVIRQHHPLVNIRRPSRSSTRIAMKIPRHSYAQSCGSHSMDRSKPGTSICSSSRHYWNADDSAGGSSHGGFVGWGAA